MSSPATSDRALGIDSADYHNSGPNIHTFRPVFVKSEAHQNAPEPFTDRTRYQVVWAERTPQGDILWTSLNALAPGALPTPTVDGPLSCECTSGGDLRYGLRSQDTWTVYADWYQEPDGERAYAPFIPSIFHGKSACAQKSVLGLLRQWNPEWVEPVAGGYKFKELFLSFAKSEVFDTDEQLRDVLRLDEARLPIIRGVPGVVSTVQELRSWWCSFARHSLVRFGKMLHLLIGGGEWRRVARERPGLHATLLEELYIYGPRGVWIEDTKNRVAEIQEFIAIGVPVFYRWEAAYIHLPGAASIAPKGRLWGPLLLQASPPSTPAPVQANTSVAGPRTPPLCSHCSATHSVTVCPTRPDVPQLGAVRPGSAVSHSPPSPSDNVQAKKPKKKVSFDGADGDADDDDDEIYFAVDLDNLKSPRHDRNSGKFSVPNDMESATADWVAFPSAPSSPAQNGYAVRTFIPVVKADEFVEPPAALRDRMSGIVHCVQRREPASPRPPAGAWIYDIGSAMAALRAAADNGTKLRNKVEVIQFALQYGLRFRTPVRVSDPKPELAAVIHAIPEEWLIKDYLPLKEKVVQWDSAVQGLLRRPHALRAALMHGGIVARIARDALPFYAQFSLGPSLSVIDYGVPAAYRLAWGSECTDYHDDYLSQAELNIVLGQFKDTTRKIGGSKHEVVSFWPSDEDMRELGYAHVWTDTWDTWYSQRRAALFRGDAPPLSASAWKKGVPRAVGDRDERTRLFQ